MPLIVEYEGGYYPFLYQKNNVKLAGVFTELWKIIADVLETEIVFVREVDRRSTFLNITEGRTLTRMDGIQLSQKRVELFTHSNVIMFVIRKFYERQRSTAELEESDFSFFTVFKWETIALIFLANLISSICMTWLANVAHTLLAKFVSQIVQTMFLLCLTVIVFHHGAGFRGNNVIIKPEQETTLPSLIDGLYYGTREFWTFSPDYISDDVYNLMIGSKNIHTVPNSESLLTKVCEDPKAVTGMPLSWNLEMNVIDNPCPLVSVKISGDQGKNTPGFETFTQTYAAHYIFSRTTDSRIVWNVNKVLSRLFTQDNIDNYWIPRAAIHLRNFKPPLAVTFAEYRPINFHRLSLVFYIFLALILTSFALFITEIAIRPSPRYYKIVQSIMSQIF